MGAMFVGQQYLQNVLGYSTWTAGLSVLPAAFVMVLLAPHSARLIEKYGSRVTLMLGYVCCMLGFGVMLFLWNERSSFFMVSLGYVFLGAGVALAGTPASRALTSAVPVRKAGMASATADLQRDLGGAIMQSIFGALLTAGYVKSFDSQIESTPQTATISDQVVGQLTRSFSSAENVASTYPQYASQITNAARESFLDGQHWAFAAGALAMALGMALVWFAYPRKDEEVAMFVEYQAAD